MKPLAEDLQILVGQFAANWRRFFAIHLAVNIIVFVVLTPAATLLLHLALALSGDAALSDEDILFFILSPVGIVSLIVIVSVFSIIVFLEFAALVATAWTSAQANPLSTWKILTALARKAPQFFRLAVLVLLRVMLNSIPFVLLLLLVYHLLLSDHDINYYLAVHPPQWQKAITWAVLIAFAWGFQLLRMFISWIFCLPMLLLEDLSPAQSLAESRSATHGQRLAIGAWILGWLLVSTLAAAAASTLVTVAGDFFIPFAVATESIKTLVIALSLVSMTGFIFSFAISFLSTSALSLMIVRMYSRTGLGHASKDFLSADGESQFHFALSRRNLSLGLSAGFLVSAVTMYGLLEQMEFEDRTEIMAHRGASHSAPENTMAAVRAAIDSGAQWVEIDVQETADGEVVVIHDRDLKKIAGVPLEVAPSSLGELQQHDIGSWFGEEFSAEKIPTLAQVLELCKNRIRVNIELKYYGAQQQLERRVADIVDANGMADQVVVMSLSLAGITAMRQLRPEWTLGLLSSVSVGDLSALEVDFLALNARFASRHLIRLMHQQGKNVMVWTVNDPVGMSVMASRGVDAIITDEPALGVSVMQQREQLEPAERLLMQLADIFQKPSLYREQ